MIMVDGGCNDVKQMSYSAKTRSSLRIFLSQTSSESSTDPREAIPVVAGTQIAWRHEYRKVLIPSTIAKEKLV